MQVAWLNVVPKPQDVAPITRLQAYGSPPLAQVSLSEAFTSSELDTESELELEYLESKVL